MIWKKSLPLANWWLVDVVSDPHDEPNWPICEGRLQEALNLPSLRQEQVGLEPKLLRPEGVLVGVSGCLWVLWRVTVHACACVYLLTCVQIAISVEVSKMLVRAIIMLVCQMLVRVIIMLVCQHAHAVDTHVTLVCSQCMTCAYMEPCTSFIFTFPESMHKNNSCQLTWPYPSCQLTWPYPSS